MLVAATRTYASSAESVPDKAAFFAFPGGKGERHPAAGRATQIGALGAANVEDGIKE